MNEMNSYSWTMDPSTGKEAMDGVVGENIITTYVNNAQPLINYRTHDLVRAYIHENRCGCGRTWRYLDGVVLGRSDYMVTVRATNVYPSAVENIVLQVPGTTNYFQLVLTRDAGGLDQMEVIFEPEPDVPESERGTIAGQIQQLLKEKIGLRMKVSAIEAGSLPRSVEKFKRIVDQRPKDYRRELDRVQS
jgi:phenylacetate-CoA ligase